MGWIKSLFGLALNCFESRVQTRYFGILPYAPHRTASHPPWALLHSPNTLPHYLVYGIQIPLLTEPAHPLFLSRHGPGQGPVSPESQQLTLHISVASRLFQPWALAVKRCIECHEATTFDGMCAGNEAVDGAVNGER